MYQGSGSVKTDLFAVMSQKVCPQSINGLFYKEYP